MPQPAAPDTPTPTTTGAAPSLDAWLNGELAKLSGGMSPIALALAYLDWAMHLSLAPERQAALARQAVEQSLQLLQNSVKPSAGSGSTPPVERDARFADPAWNQWPFVGLKEAFKASEKWWGDATQQVEGMSRHHQHMVNFFARHTLDALSPSNWAGTNPEVLRKARETGGQNLLDGVRHFTQDLMELQKAKPETEAEELRPLPYVVGQDVAVTPGKVVFRNPLIELIQYSPTTREVRPEPLLIVPSCIMKYYILDLSPENSMVRYLVAQGFTVFIISWRNPDASDRDLGMCDYLQRGVMDAMAVVQERSGAGRIHAMGYCLGGTFLSIVAAALGQRKPAQKGAAQNRRRADDRSQLEHLPELASVTLLAAQTDFTEPGQLGVFIDDDQIKTLREDMARKGYLSGRQMAGSFQFLNARDLVWTRNTRRYLLGLDEVGNDMMSWNADLTRLPERMHAEYLSSLFLNNALASGHYRVNNVGVALMDIKAPMMVVGTVRDHVSPWRSVYKIHLLTDTQTTFILAAGGHNAGIISEPGHANRSYQMAYVEKGHGWTEPDEWQANAPTFQGSWWEAWSQWLGERSGKPVPARAIDRKSAICAAPGEYVKVRYAD